jgi:hypothetical protein
MISIITIVNFNSISMINKCNSHLGIIQSLGQTSLNEQDIHLLLTLKALHFKSNCKKNQQEFWIDSNIRQYFIYKVKEVPWSVDMDQGSLDSR